MQFFLLWNNKPITQLKKTNHDIINLFHSLKLKLVLNLSCFHFRVSQTILKSHLNKANDMECSLHLFPLSSSLFEPFSVFFLNFYFILCFTCVYNLARQMINSPIKICRHPKDKPISLEIFKILYYLFSQPHLRLYRYIDRVQCFSY